MEKLQAEIKEDYNREKSTNNILLYFAYFIGYI